MGGDRWLLLRANRVCGGREGVHRVTLHGESCPVGAMAPAHIDLVEECERARVCVCVFPANCVHVIKPFCSLTLKHVFLKL